MTPEPSPATRVPGRVGERRIGYRAVLRIDGDLDGAVAAELADAFSDAVEAGAREIWLDLPASARLDPSGTDMLARLGCVAHELARALVIVCPPGPARAALTAVSAGHELEIYDTVDAAQRDRW